MVFVIVFLCTTMCVVRLQEMAPVSESFMKTSRGVLSELLPLANGVRQELSEHESALLRRLD